MNESRKEITVRTSYDEMEAFVILRPPLTGEVYSPEEVVSALSDKKVKIGVDEEKIAEIVTKGWYGREFAVAAGKPAKDGVDGYYEYLFRQELSNKPTIRKDGSVDYRSIHNVEVVEEGQTIAIYHAPVDGHNGMTVTGRLLTCKRGRPQPPLAGRGFTRSEDGMSYLAALTGKIEMVNGRVMVLPVFEVRGDVGVSTGNIDFRGDVIIYGNVTSGANIYATGNVTVDGTAEACTITAGKDIVLKGGFLGGNRGRIKAAGNITARFLEYGSVEAEGNIECTSALNCNITSYNRLSITGKTANVVGGSVYATAGVEANSIGNDIEVKTLVQVGVSQEMFSNMSRLRMQVAETETLIEKINAGIQQFDEAAAAAGVDMKNDERRVALLRTRIAKQAELVQNREQLLHLESVAERGRDAAIRVLRDVYPGVLIGINSSLLPVKEKQRAVEFRESESKVLMYALGGVV